MDQRPGHRILFDMFESSGIGLIGLDAADRICQLNSNTGIYLDLDPESVIGKPAATLQPQIRSVEFWQAFPGTFYCLAPGPHNLLLIVCRTLGPEHGSELRRAIILRPYSLEREFGRMRVCLNNYLAHEIASHLSSIGIASEFITEPELRESRQTREAFISTFRHDVIDLNQLFVHLMETAEPLIMPTRIGRGRLDWKALVEDQAAKIRGLASEKNVTLSCSLPPYLPAVAGDYHWLNLALFGILAHVLRNPPPLTEVSLTANHGEGNLETAIVTHASEDTSNVVWPPPSLFPLDEEHPRIGRMEITDLIISRSILHLHGGDLRREETEGRIVYTIVLPA